MFWCHHKCLHSHTASYRPPTNRATLIPNVNEPLILFVYIYMYRKNTLNYKSNAINRRVNKYFY